MQDVPSSSVPHLPNAAAMRMVIQRARNKNLPNLPLNIHDVEIPECYAKINSEPFLIGHYTHENQSVLVFSTKENLTFLSAARYWLMDGTFQCSPRPYVQLYTVHAQVGTEEGSHKILPLVFGLLSHKTQRCYQIFMEIMRRYAINHCNIVLAPNMIITDFETAAINAVKNVFRNCQQKLCFFHLTQSIWRHIQSAGLAKRYGSDSVFAHKLRHLAGLAFLEPAEIPSAFEMIKNEVIPEEGKKVLYN